MSYPSNPTRRNRNIGTSKQGHGQDNQASVPQHIRDRWFDWHRKRPHRIVHREVFGRQLPFRVEETLPDSVHACTVDDVAQMLRLLPRDHVGAHFLIDDDFYEIDGISGVVLGQPSRSEYQHSPVWGRLAYSEFVEGKYGPVIFIEAQLFPMKNVWGRHLGPDAKREQKRLERFASRAEVTKRGSAYTFDVDAVRALQLYHTVPHEVGHWVDKLQSVDLPSRDGDPSLAMERYFQLSDRYHQRTRQQLEAFAHRYADEARAKHEAAGEWPWDRKVDAEALRREVLRLEDFQLPDSP